jgi:FAD-dependent urate hydroxylase
VEVASSSSSEHPAPFLGCLTSMPSNAGSTMSHGALAGDIPGLAFGANRLSSAIASRLFEASAGALASTLWDHEDRELQPTRYFLPR